MAGSLTGAVALTTSHNSPQRILVTGRIWLYAGTSGVSGGTNLERKLFDSKNLSSADNQQERLWNFLENPQRLHAKRRF